MPAKGSKKKIYVPTPESRTEVIALSGSGMTVAEIAEHFKITPPTLRKYYKAELKISKSKLKSLMVRQLVQKALAGDKQCLFFWLQKMGGFGDPAIAAKLVDSDGKPLSLENLSGAALSEFIASVRKTLPTGSRGVRTIEAEVGGFEAEERALAVEPWQADGSSEE